MRIETSSFGDNAPDNIFEYIQQLHHNGATSDSFKVSIHGKWHFLKRPKKEFVDNPIYLTAFEREFELGFSLDNQCIVRYRDKGRDKEGFYILTEYVDGKTLREYLVLNQKLDKAEALRIITQIGDALRYLHSRQIVHLDLKPDNILITNNGNNVKLIDLGFSFSDCYEAFSCGSKSFSSPEQFEKPQEADLRSDIYAFGKIIYEIAPNRYSKVVRRATAKNKEERFQSIDALLHDLNKKSKCWVWLGVVVIVIIGFIVYKNSPLKSIETPTTLDSVVQMVDTVVIQQRVEVASTKSHSAIDEYRTQTRNSYKEVFAELFQFLKKSDMKSEETDKIVPLATTAYYKACELDDKRVKEFLKKYPDLEPDFRVINEQEMAVNMGLYNKQYSDIYDKFFGESKQTQNINDTIK